MLTRAAIKHVHAAIDKLFDHLKVVYLGSKLAATAPKGVDKAIAVGYRHELSLPGLYESAAEDEGFKASEDTLASLHSIASGYIDAQKERTKAQVIKDVNAVLGEARTSGVETDLKTALGGALAQTFERVTNSVNRIVDSEAQNGRAIGTLEGIMKINSASGIDDPTVFFVIVRDKHVCDECVRLHMHDDGVTPRAWKLSSLGHGYHKKGDPTPKVGGLHPHCRCSLATLMPGYGFDDAGRVKYVGPDHDEFEAQRQ